MKKIFLLIGMVSLFGLQSCSGPEGPEGPPGSDGTNVEAEVYEITDVDFLSNGNFSIVADLPHTILSSDMVLVYRLSDVFNGADVWRLEPETFYFADGTLDFRYNFDFTRTDVSIYLEGNDLGTVPEEFRLNQVFRIVIIPGYFSNKKAVDLKDYNAVIKAYNLNDSNPIKL
ncbi:MAG: hypothetical protein V4548_03975 [Bacteroidota bacterium]